MNSTALMCHPILEIHNLSLEHYTINELSISSGEWINVMFNDESFKESFVDALLLKSNHFDGLYFGLHKDNVSRHDKQALRRRLSYWPMHFENHIDDLYLKTKEDLTRNSTSKDTHGMQIFLDHLMVGEELNAKYKRLINALLMNIPEMLIIDKALSVLPSEIRKAVLSKLTAFSKKSGMAILNIAADDNDLQSLTGRCFTDKSQSLIEIM